MSYTIDSDSLKRCADMEDVTPEGIVFDWELAGPDGASFVLFPAPWHTPDEIKSAENYLRSNRDVV